MLDAPGFGTTDTSPRAVPFSFPELDSLPLTDMLDCLDSSAAISPVNDSVDAEVGGDGAESGPLEGRSGFGSKQRPPSTLGPSSGQSVLHKPSPEPMSGWSLPHLSDQDERADAPASTTGAALGVQRSHP